MGYREEYKDHKKEKLTKKRIHIEEGLAVFLVILVNHSQLSMRKNQKLISKFH